jgi:cyclohexanecarboxylate-CoA ligase
MTALTELRPSPATIDDYRRRGLWRAEHLLDDLRRHRRERPGEIAILGYHAEGEPETVTWGRLADEVERIAGSLRELGAGPGKVVAVQLPNQWETIAVLLACLRTGAVIAPLVPEIRSRELERILAQLEAGIVVTRREWAGHDHAAALDELAPRLPHLRHRVIDFAWPDAEPLPLDGAALDPDQVALVLYTSGTTGEPKAVLHTVNTITAVNLAIMADEGGHAPADRGHCPHALTHIFGITVGIVLPLLTGMTSVILDDWTPPRAADIVERARVGAIFGAAILVAAVINQGRDLTSLRYLFSGGAPIPPPLAHFAHAKTGVPLRSGWAMTEVPLGTWTRPGDPADWATRIDGSPSPVVELDLRADGPGPARLFVRGAGVCLALAGRDSGEVTMLDGDWYDTGDLVLPDGRGGIRHVGRVEDRIGSGYMIPIADVEGALHRHPSIADVALVGYHDENGHESPCAFIVPAGPPPTLDDLRTHLTTLGMTGFWQPTRVEIVPTLPRNRNGKILKRDLRVRLNDRQSADAPVQ